MCDKPPSSPETNNASLHPGLDSKLDEAAKRVLDFYLTPKPEAKKKPASNQLFTVVEGIDAECLLANLSETLASANATLRTWLSSLMVHAGMLPWVCSS